MLTTRDFIDAFNRCTSHGWLDWEEGLLLATWADTTRGPMVEVGSYMGRSACLLAQLRDKENPLVRRRLYCVDPWDDAFSSDMPGEEVYRRFLANVAGIPGANVTAVRCRVEDWKPVVAEFVYCDGDHSYSGTLAQIRQGLHCGPSVIAVHDVSDGGDGLEVRRACVELLGPWTERLGKLAVWEMPGGKG